MTPPPTLLAAALTSIVASLHAQSPAPRADPPASDAPKRGLLVSEPGAFAGFTLFSPLRSGTTFLVDMKGEVVHRWDVGTAPGNMAYLLDNGHLLRPTRIDDHPRFFGGGISGRIQELDWDGKVVWDYVLADEARMSHHDLEVLPNGHLLAIVWEHRSREQAVALGRDPKITSEKGWWPDALLELEPLPPNGARIVWEWHAIDHLVHDKVADHPELLDINCDRPVEAAPPSKEELEKREKRRKEMQELGYAGGDEDEEPPPAADGGRIDPDWTHTNGIDYHPELDLIVMSSPHANEIWVIDHSTTTDEARGHTGGRWGHGGDFLYRWGNPKNYGAGSAADQKLFGQHDPQWVFDAPAGELRCLLFNNGSERIGGEYSSADELVLPFARDRGFLREPGQRFGPTAPAWTYAAPERESFYSFFISGVQRLPNGNTLVCSGKQGRFFEVTREGKVVWEYWNPHGGELEHSVGRAAPKRDRPSPVDPVSVFQATRIAPDHPGLRGRKLVASAK